MFVKGHIKLELSLVSSILNYASYKELVNYICVQTHKEFITDEYVCFKDLNNLAFFTESDWNKSMDKLVLMGLACKNGSKYVTKTKLHSWKEFATINSKESLKLNGFILFDVYQLMRLKENEDLKDLIYLTLHKSVIRGKSMSRKFVQLVTGLSSQCQKNIEKKHQGVFVEVNEHHIPVGDTEIENKKVGEIPVLRGFVSPKRMDCIKTPVKKSNCNIIQLGNIVKVKNVFLSYYKPNQGSFSKRVSNINQLNNFSLENEVVAWDSLDMTVDSSEDGKTNKRDGIISYKDSSYYVMKDIKNYNFDNVAQIDANGCFTNFRMNLNR